MFVESVTSLTTLGCLASDAMGKVLDFVMGCQDFGSLQLKHRKKLLTS